MASFHLCVRVAEEANSIALFDRSPLMPLFVTEQNNEHNFVCGETSCSGRYNSNEALDKGGK